MGVLRFAPPGSVSVWDVHHKFWYVHHRNLQTPSGAIAKMDHTDSAFPRAILAVLVVMSITDHDSESEVLTHY
jgi:hypothetical protein